MRKFLTSLMTFFVFIFLTSCAVVTSTTTTTITTTQKEFNNLERYTLLKDYLMDNGTEQSISGSFHIYQNILDITLPSTYDNIYLDYDVMNDQFRMRINLDYSLTVGEVMSVKVHFTIGKNSLITQPTYTSGEFKFVNQIISGSFQPLIVNVTNIQNTGKSINNFTYYTTSFSSIAISQKNYIATDSVNAMNYGMTLIETYIYDRLGFYLFE